MKVEAVIGLLKEAYRRFLAGDWPGYQIFLADAKKNMSEVDAGQAWLCGEWLLVASLDHLRDLRRLIRDYDEAIACMGGRRSVVFDAHNALGFSDDSVLWMMLHEPGTADETDRLFREAVSRYEKLTTGGPGYAEFFRAELLYQRGELADARVLAYQSVYLAQSTQQLQLAMSAAKLLGSIAMHFRDMGDWSYAVKTVSDIALDEYTSHSMESLMPQRAQVIRGLMLVQLGDYAEVPEWLEEGRFGVRPGKGVFGLDFLTDDPHISAFDYPLALWTHTLYTLKTGQFARVLAADAVQRMFGLEREFLCYKILYGLTRGLTYLLQGQRARALEEFMTAVELVKPDGLWLTVAEFAPASDGLLFEAVKNCGGDVALVRRLAKGVADNAAKLREAITGTEVEGLLTPRELEIARLAAGGMRNREIAERLSVTEQTVKFHLSNIYSKLDVNNRAKLAGLLKTPTKDYTKV